MEIVIGLREVPYYHYEKPYVFLRDVDVEPIVLESEEVFNYPFQI